MLCLRSVLWNFLVQFDLKFEKFDGKSGVTSGGDFRPANIVRGNFRGEFQRNFRKLCFNFFFAGGEGNFVQQKCNAENVVGLWQESRALACMLTLGFLLI